MICENCLHFKSILSQTCQKNTWRVFSKLKFHVNKGKGLVFPLIKAKSCLHWFLGWGLRFINSETKSSSFSQEGQRVPKTPFSGFILSGTGAPKKISQPVTRGDCTLWLPAVKMNWGCAFKPLHHNYQKVQKWDRTWSSLPKGHLQLLKSWKWSLGRRVAQY